MIVMQKPTALIDAAGGLAAARTALRTRIEDIAP
jgi:hypothetical protein